MLHITTDDGRHQHHCPPPVSPKTPYILPMSSSSMMAPMLSYGIHHEAWTLFPDEQQMTRDLNHISHLSCNPGLYPDITPQIVPYCKRIDNLLQNADQTITRADVQAIVAIYNGYMQNYTNATVLRVTNQQTTLKPMLSLLPTPTLTPAKPTPKLTPMLTCTQTKKHITD